MITKIKKRRQESMGASEERTVQDATMEVLNCVIQVLWHVRVHVSLLVLEAAGNTAGLF